MKGDILRHVNFVFLGLLTVFWFSGSLAEFYPQENKHSTNSNSQTNSLQPVKTGNSTYIGELILVDVARHNVNKTDSDPGHTEFELYSEYGYKASDGTVRVVAPWLMVLLFLKGFGI